MSAKPDRATSSPAYATQILRRLRDHYGKPERPVPDDPIGGLISTILSQNTSDTNTDRAYASLTTRFPTWDEVEAAPVEEVEKAIRVGGLARQKAPRIQQVLREIRRDRGCHSLEFLVEKKPEDVASWLVSLDGVGPKTAACVQLFNLGHDVLPVDTHVHRVSQRLGLVPAKASAVAAQPILESLIVPGDRYDAHVLLIQHGRMICKARRPRCSVCPLQSICPSADEFLQGDPSASR